MFERLKTKWKVSNSDLLLILLTFALTGTSTAWITRMITSWVPVAKWSPEWIILKFSILLFGYQILILIFGFLLGQFAFFWNYEKKILKRIGFFPNKYKKTVRLAVFASGTGTNFRRIIDYFRNHKKISVSVLVCDNPGAGAMDIARENGIPVIQISKGDLMEGRDLKKILGKNRIDFLILAGFLKKIPPVLIEAYPRRIINIHPALLPKFGGKGMYGARVHEEVIRSGDAKSGITIHFVDEHYDSGDVIFQKECAVEKGETAESLARKIHKMEHEYFAPQIEKLADMQKTS